MRVHAAWTCAILASMGQLAWAAGLDKPIVTNKARFRIPYKFDAQALQKMNAKELQLFLSTDQGRTWERTQSIAPDSGKFEFQAPADGNYWFAVRTLDGNNQLHPPGQQLEPGLWVLVDATEPRLDLTLQPAADGKIQLSWNATDTNLEATTLKLEYLQSGSNSWQPVAVIPRASGQTSWNLPATGIVAARGTISDTAGNSTSSQTQYEVTPSSKPAMVSPHVPIYDRRHPIAESPASPTLGLTDQYPQPDSSFSPSFRNLEPRGEGTGLPRFPVDQRPVLAPQRETAVITPFQSSQLVSSAAPNRPQITGERFPGSESAGTTVPPRTDNSRTRVVNSRRFQVGYRVDDVGPSGVGGVELFVTENRGRQWFKYGDDPDRRSPFEVEVPRDGEFGFAIRVRSGAGLIADPPQPNEAPSIVVVVDETPPRLELLPVQQGQGLNTNQLVISWKIDDEHPSDKPISIYFSSHPQGPWEPISAWRADTGQMEWTMSANNPSQIYLRLLGRDAAGNIATVDSRQPIVVDLTRPSARIVDIEPQATGSLPR